MKRLLLVCSVMLLCIGCTKWVPDQKPETQEERECVERVQGDILSHTPLTLSGDDQDWDDAIVQAHNVAAKTCCKTRLYEFSWDARTGKMKEVDKP